MSQDKRQKRDLHALNEEGMVLCNPRDREAAHRAEMEGIATEDHGRNLPELPGPAVQAHQGDTGAVSRSEPDPGRALNQVIQRECGGDLSEPEREPFYAV